MAVDGSVRDVPDVVGDAGVGVPAAAVAGGDVRIALLRADSSVLLALLAVVVTPAGVGVDDDVAPTPPDADDDVAAAPSVPPTGGLAARARTRSPAILSSHNNTV
jgi:hypothetical protein